MTYAERHFKRLNILRLFCILFALSIIIVIGLFFVTEFLKQQQNMLHEFADIKFDQVKVLSDTTIAVKTLNIEKIGNNDVVYHLLADYATKNLQGIIDMEDITLLYDKNNTNNTITIKAKTGSIDENDKQIYIDSLAYIYFKDYNIIADKLHMDLQQNMIKSNETVHLIHQQYKFVADSFVATQDTKIVKFDGHVRATINLQNTDFIN